MNENLATVQEIKEIRPHTNSDNLELATILGWQVVVKKDEFKVGDFVIYMVIDTVLPEHSEFEFLRNKKFRIKPIRLRGEESAGIAFPVSILGKFGYDFRGPLHKGMDVTDIIGVKHFEKPVPAELSGQMVGHIPGFLIITDEDNLRTYPDAVPELKGHPYYITRKDDGSSGTYFINNEEFGVCSRRIHLKPSDTNGFWKMEYKYNIENILRKEFPGINIAIQGEVCGPGIQKNKIGLKEVELHIFNIFDIVNRTYLDYDKVKDFCLNYNIPMVTLIEEGDSFEYDLNGLINLANQQKYPTGGNAEGIVIRPKQGFYSKELKKFWSGKVLNEKYKED